MDFDHRLTQPEISWQDKFLCIKSIENVNPVFVRFPELLQVRPVRFDTFDDGSFPIDVKFSISPPSGEFRYKVFWLAPFSTKVHIWYVDQQGKRREAAWLSDEEASVYFEAGPISSAKITRRLALATDVDDELIGVAVGCLWQAQHNPRFCDAELAATALNSNRLSPLSTAEPLIHLAAGVAEKYSLEENKSFENYNNGKCFAARFRPIISALSSHETRLTERARNGLVQLDVMARADTSVDFGTPLAPPKIGTAKSASDNTYNFEFCFCKPGTLQINESVNSLNKPRVVSPIRFINEIVSNYYSDNDMQIIAKEKYGISVGDRIKYAIQFGDAPVNKPSLAYGLRQGFESVTMVPDPYFTESKGFFVMRKMTNQHWVAWRDRDDSIFWRGQSTGLVPLSLETLPELPRFKLCSQSRSIEGVDCKFVSIVQAPDDKTKKDLISHCANLGLMEKWVPEIDMIKRKFVVDIDGNVNSWGFFTKLLMGNCVLKVKSAEMWSQWYYEDLVPWKHYVPLKSDLSDFKEIIEWCRANLPACEAISREARDFALRRSYSSEMRLSGELLLRSACGVPVGKNVS